MEWLAAEWAAGAYLTFYGLLRASFKTLLWEMAPRFHADRMHGQDTEAELLAPVPQFSLSSGGSGAAAHA